MPNDATAYGHRDAPYDLNILAGWLDPSDTEKNVAWTRQFFEAVRPHLSGGVYVNDLDRDETEDRVRSAYGANYPRLAGLKARFDPTNLFRMNNNIRPGASA